MMAGHHACHLHGHARLETRFCHRTPAPPLFHLFVHKLNKLTLALSDLMSSYHPMACTETTSTPSPFSFRTELLSNAAHCCLVAVSCTSPQAHTCPTVWHGACVLSCSGFGWLTWLLHRMVWTCGMLYVMVLTATTVLNSCCRRLAWCTFSAAAKGYTCTGRPCVGASTAHFSEQTARWQLEGSIQWSMHPVHDTTWHIRMHAHSCLCYS